MHALFFLLFSASLYSQNRPPRTEALTNPISYFSGKPKGLMEHAYFANVSPSKAIQFFQDIGMIRYSAENYDPGTIRFRNSSQKIFVMVFRKSSGRVYILISRTEYVDEIDV